MLTKMSDRNFNLVRLQRDGKKVKELKYIFDICESCVMRVLDRYKDFSLKELKKLNDAENDYKESKVSDIYKCKLDIIIYLSNNKFPSKVSGHYLRKGFKKPIIEKSIEELLKESTIRRFVDGEDYRYALSDRFKNLKEATESLKLSEEVKE